MGQTLQAFQGIWTQACRILVPASASGSAASPRRACSFPSKEAPSRERETAWPAAHPSRGKAGAGWGGGRVCKKHTVRKIIVTAPSDGNGSSVELLKRKVKTSGSCLQALRVFSNAARSEQDLVHRSLVGLGLFSALHTLLVGV